MRKDAPSVLLATVAVPMERYSGITVPQSFQRLHVRDVVYVQVNVPWMQFRSAPSAMMISTKISIRQLFLQKMIPRKFLLSAVKIQLLKQQVLQKNSGLQCPLVLR